MNTRSHTTTPEHPEKPPGEPGQVVSVSAFMRPILGVDARPVHVVAVLKRGVVDDYAVYEAVVQTDPLADEPLDLSAGGAVARWVAAHGTKLRYEDALRHFPSMPRRWYRA